MQYVKLYEIKTKKMRFMNLERALGKVYNITKWEKWDSLMLGGWNSSTGNRKVCIGTKNKPANTFITTKGQFEGYLEKRKVTHFSDSNEKNDDSRFIII